MPVVRDVQFLQAQTVHLMARPQHVFLSPLPRASVGGLRVPALRQLDDLFYAFVRMAPNRRNLIGKAPLPGSFITLHWDNSDPSMGKPHIESKERKDIWKGHVIQNDDGVSRTGTNFCILLAKPKQGKQMAARQVLERLTDEQLWLAHMELEIDTTAADREIAGAQRLADPSFNKDTLDPIRDLFMNDNPRDKVPTADLTRHRPELWKKYIQYVAAGCQDNEMQLKVVESLQHVRGRIEGVVGAPGAGKTKTLSDTVIGAALQGYSTLTIGPSNTAVDRAVVELYEAWMRVPNEIKKSPENPSGEKLFLRLETQSTELRAMLTIKNFTDQSLQDPAEAPETEDERLLEDDLSLRHACHEAASNFSHYTEQLAAEFKK